MRDKAKRRAEEQKRREEEERLALAAKLEQTLKKTKQQSERRPMAKANPFGAADNRENVALSSEEPTLRKGLTQTKSPAAKTTKLLGA